MAESLLRPTLAVPLSGVRLRPWHLHDAPVLAETANDRGIWQNLRDVFPHPYRLEDAYWYIGLTTDPDSPDIHLAIEVEGEAAGAISVLFKDDINRCSAEIGYWLGRQYWGRGIVAEAVKVLTDYTFAHFEVCRLYAEIFARNAASARVLSKAGYEQEARLQKSIVKEGEVQDALLFARIRP
ncbi:GNAT family N-acetyltransferase [Hymenobacter sp. BT635]|uniref:GNAT family N-acetyltransferase n=1 Tax=Hymenobacter nitidus TaxID=2880929 RepID=A0ABS8AIS3_9BACT|nr:GNAT family N-acetyltransferase [Hymenobacter nitidus]MCB2380191.1 GNAT family N-acetyltransferase [Hymenobacter nitidus]